MSEFIIGNWVMSAARPIAALLIASAFTFITKTIRAQFGHFSRSYIAMTTTRNEQIKELVKYKHITNKIKGKIYGVAFVVNKVNGQSTLRNNNIYCFVGVVSAAYSFNYCHVGI